VGRVKLRGKILDNTGKLLGEVETFAGNLLTDEELNRLSDKEILAELQRPEGSDMPNTGIRSRASIPFMIVFMNPPKEVDEFIIELAGWRGRQPPIDPCLSANPTRLSWRMSCGRCIDRRSQDPGIR